MMRRSLLLTLLALTVAVPALAQGRLSFRDRSWEFTVQTRYAFSKTYNGEGDSSVQLQDDLGWGFGFAYNLNVNWSVGFGVAWRSVPYSTTIVGENQEREQYSGSLSVSTIAASGTWNVLDGMITPYASGTIGWTLIDTNIFAGVGSGCWWDPWWGYVCGTYPTTYGTTALSLAGGAGLRAELSQSFFLRGGYEYAWVDVNGLDGGTHTIRVDIGWLFGS
jgi:opacity protein-like surface antigen